MKSNVHYFSQKEIIPKTVSPDILGQRGRQANEFAELGLPILPGFVIDSEIASNLAGEKILEKIKPYIKKVENEVGKTYNNEKNPLVLKIVISSNLAVSNYPTLHNFGLTSNTINGFNSFVGENFGNHELMFMIRGMLKIEEKIAEFENRDNDLKKIQKTLSELNAILGNDKIEKNANDIAAEYKNFLPKGFFDDAWTQLEEALLRISQMLYLDEQNADDTAILVQPMVYGNYGKDSSSGEFYTRNIVTGEKKLQGEFFVERFNEIGAKGDDINKIGSSHLKQMEKIAGQIEDYIKEIRMVRFTIENGKLWLIEQRQVVAKSMQADIKFLLDLYERKVADDIFVIKSVNPGRLSEILHPVVDLSSVKKLTGFSGGIAGAPGSAIGRIYFSTESLMEAYREAQLKGNDKRLILCMASTFAEDVKAIEVASGVLSCEGGYSAHASVVARQYGKTSLVLPDMKIRGKKAIINENTVSEGDYITINVPYYGKPGVWFGKGSLIEPDPKESGLFEFIDIAKKRMKKFHVRANADSPRDAALALSFGAEGIGLCRTEHMFFEEKRINIFREMIFAETLEDRIRALNKLQPFQREDFYGLFLNMKGKDVTIRLLDAPLHEFLPHNEKELASFIEHLNKVRKDKPISKSEVIARIDSIDEFNPMLGHRGCRIAVSYPEIYQMQVRAIFEAVFKLQSEKVDVHPEIMIPIVMNSSELKLILFGKKIEGRVYQGLMDIEEEIRTKLNAKPVDYKVGTMIELPAAALSANEIARYSEFFSFGTNDLTQTTLGISRDDFNSFMPDYSLFDLIDGNPFSKLTEPVKELISVAVRRGKLTRPALIPGLCGEHGANPENIRFCMDAGLEYVSCSPYSVPLATLTVAQNEIERMESAENK